MKILCVIILVILSHSFAGQSSAQTPTEKLLRAYKRFCLQSDSATLPEVTPGFLAHNDIVPLTASASDELSILTEISKSLTSNDDYASQPLLHAIKDYTSCILRGWDQERYNVGPSSNEEVKAICETARGIGKTTAEDLIFESRGVKQDKETVFPLLCQRLQVAYKLTRLTGKGSFQENTWDYIDKHLLICFLISLRSAVQIYYQTSDEDSLEQMTDANIINNLLPGTPITKHSPEIEAFSAYLKLIFGDKEKWEPDRYLVTGYQQHDITQQDAFYKDYLIIPWTDIKTDTEKKKKLVIYGTKLSPQFEEWDQKLQIGVGGLEPTKVDIIYLDFIMRDDLLYSAGLPFHPPLKSGSLYKKHQPHPNLSSSDSSESDEEEGSDKPHPYTLNEAFFKTVYSLLNPGGVFIFRINRKPRRNPGAEGDSDAKKLTTDEQFSTQLVETGFSGEKIKFYHFSALPLRIQKEHLYPKIEFTNEPELLEETVRHKKRSKKKKEEPFNLKGILTSKKFREAKKELIGIDPTFARVNLRNYVIIQK